MGTDTSTALAELSAAGVSIWPDDISRDRLNTGNLADLVTNKHVVGVTSQRGAALRVVGVRWWHGYLLPLPLWQGASV